MDRALQEVGEHVTEASALTTSVSEGADQGAKAVAETIADIERIHTRTNQAKQRLGELVHRISEVGSILDVIGEINDETKLLSLNAAIIAAQAGERGKSFLVVANHVKLLARRTAQSTEEIAGLIESVQQDSDAAVEAMDAGIEVIEQGVDRSRVAGNSLQNILESASEASSRVDEIARTAREQTRTSGHVAEATQRTSDQVRQIAGAIGHLSESAQKVLSSCEAALGLCEHVHRSTDEQRETGRYITDSINLITEMTRAIHESATAHDKTGEEVSNSVTRLLENAQQSGEHVPAIRDMLTELSSSTGQIAAELASFTGVARSPSEPERPPQPAPEA
jgi:methyl-accepting chemotaxis protein